MRLTIYISLFIFMMASCASDRPWFEKAERYQVSSKAAVYFAPTPEADLYAMDSILYDRLIESGSSDFCAMAAAFAMSDVQLERQLPNRCHSQFYDFNYVSAEIEFDTLTITFKTQNLRHSIANNKLMRIKVLGRDHYAEIIHWGADYREVTRIDGKVETRRSPASDIVDTRLKLDKPYYELGDTIRGEIKIDSYQVKGRRRTKIKERTLGKFRAIVGGAGIECEPAKALATSWLK